MTTTTSFPAATVLGYPRIGANRELKRAIEAFWSGGDNNPAETAAQLRAARNQTHSNGADGVRLLPDAPWAWAWSPGAISGARTSMPRLP